MRLQNRKLWIDRASALHLFNAYAAAFDKYGRAEFSSREECLGCLSKLWFEIYNRHGGKNVCIPILGSGAAEFVGGSGKTATQQECLDVMLRSYLLCTHKVKSPNRLCIVCRPQEGFSINKIGLVYTNKRLGKANVSPSKKP